jgi:transcriptional regulator with XRE-family HTH domain
MAHGVTSSLTPIDYGGTTMHTSLQLIDLAKQHLSLAHNLPLPMTDYRVAKLLGINPNTLSNWRTGKNHIGSEFAQKFALACDLPEAYVFACIEHERAQAARQQATESCRQVMIARTPSASAAP